ncbi:MAG: PAS domain-containing sensor histidine kinase [Fibrobacterota bacterium]
MAKPSSSAGDFTGRLPPRERELFNECIEQEARKSAELVKLMHIIESISTKIHAFTDAAGIFKAVTHELEQHSKYIGAVLLLDKTGSAMTLASISFRGKALRAMKKLSGLSMARFSIDVEKTNHYRQVLKEGRTLFLPSEALIKDILPGPVARARGVLSKFDTLRSIIAPLHKNGAIIGAISISASDLSEHIVPSINNLARHISLSLELADEIKRRRDAEQRAISILEGVGEAITIHDFDGRILQVNTEFEKGMGFRREELVGKSPAELGWVTPEQQRYIQREIMPKLMKTGRAFDEELIATTRNGKTFPTSVNWSLMHDETGRPVAVINAAKDISRLREAEAQLKEFSKKILAVREEEKKKLSSDLHDELGTMVVALTSALSLADEELKGGGNAEDVRFHLRQARQLIINYVGRLKGIALDLRPPQLDLIGLSAALRELFAGAGKRHGHRIDFHEALGNVKIPDEDAIALYRVAQEALTNAVRHSDAKRITANIARRSGRIVLWVRDNGCGFNAEKVLRRPGSIGITGMVERMEARGGKLTVVSRPGKGTLVRAALPEAAKERNGD